MPVDRSSSSEPASTGLRTLLQATAIVAVAFAAAVALAAVALLAVGVTPS